MSTERSGPQQCSFCRRVPSDGRRGVSGPEAVFICDECVDLCKEILEQAAKSLDEDLEEFEKLLKETKE